MPATIVVGGQYGSEGKGKVTALLAAQSESPWLVRCGGPNSGHTVTINGKDVVMRQIPSCSEPDKAVFCISAGCVVDEPLLLQEAEALKIDPERIIVDPRAVLVTEDDRELERGGLATIASTCSGTGAALVRRMSRRPDVRLVKDSVAIKQRCRVETVAPRLHEVLAKGGDVIVEGTQGFALSLLHGSDFPFVTSRDTTAAGFAMEVGLSPRHVDQIVMVIRTFPIRVGGTSGPFKDEITWDDVRELSGAPQTYPEFTSVTKRLRRVAKFDLDQVKRACEYNKPSYLAVMGLDRLDFSNTGLTNISDISPASRVFLRDIYSRTGVPIGFIGTGFTTSEAIASVGLQRSIPLLS